MRIISLLLLCCPFILFSQTTREKYALNGAVKYYKKEHLVKPQIVRGFVKRDNEAIETYVDIPRILEVHFNKQGYVTRSQGIRYAGNGGDWERVFEYFKIGDTLTYSQTYQNYGQTETYDCELHFRGDNKVYEYSHTSYNFETTMNSRTKETRNTYDRNNRLTNSKTLETKEYRDGKIDTVSTAIQHTYNNDKLWSWQYFHKGKPGQIHYFPFLGSKKYFTQTDSIFTGKNKLKLIRTSIANNTKVVEIYNYAEHKINKYITEYDEFGKQISETSFNYYSIKEDRYHSATVNITTFYDGEKGTIKTDALYNINLDTNLIGDSIYFRSYDRTGRVLRHRAAEIIDLGYGTPEINVAYEYIENTDGHLIKVIKKKYVDQQAKIDQITNYVYDPKNNLIYEKTIDSDNTIVSEIKYTIDYYDE